MQNELVIAQINYSEAVRLGHKELRRGSQPDLPVLDELIPSRLSSPGIYLGEMQIPLSMVVGTKTAGRESAFAPNFMPLFPDNTEFVSKWKTLYNAHVSEGIREPIKVYEYLNRFYVEEGNKRVSVLKYCGAYSVAAKVTRIMPEINDSEEIRLYLEFVEFNRCSKIFFVEFSKPGSYRELTRAMGKKEDERWTEDERKLFTSVYYRFEKAYRENGGDKLKNTVGDAMLSYIRVYGYAELSRQSREQIVLSLKKMWEEITLNEQTESIELKTAPGEEKKSIVQDKVRFLGKSKLKAAFVYDTPPENAGWVHDHDIGRQYACFVLGDKLETAVYIADSEDTFYQTIEQAIADGCDLIFTILPGMIHASLRTAVEHPDVIILNCSLNTAHRYVRTYYMRMYEVKFILGVLAGSLTESGRLGYVCDCPVYGRIAEINAFALGAQMANPDAEVCLEWTAVKGEEAARSLIRRDIDMICSQDTTRFIEDDRSSFGLSRVENDAVRLLALPVWKWGVFYERIVRSVLDKSIKSKYTDTPRALNYFWGMSAGVVDVEYAVGLPLPSARFADFFRNSLISGTGTPFLTPFYTQSGQVIGERPSKLRTEQIINMDYLVENVIGGIPSFDELSDLGKSTVSVMGVAAAKPQSNNGK